MRPKVTTRNVVVDNIVDTIDRRIAVHLFALVSLLFTLPAVAPAVAQQAETIEELVVTAQKREQSLQEVPLSITALSADELDVLGVRSLRDLVDGVIPALKVSPYPNSPATLNLTMRGTSAADAGSTFTELPVGIYIDGIYLGRAQGAGVDIVDIERLEVLRGPQGTLYGRNNVGGAVNFVTKKPTGEFSFKQTASGGTNWGEWDSISRVDLPAWNWLGGEFKMRFSYLRSEDDGWVDNPNVPGQGDFDSNYWAQSKEAWRTAIRWDWSNVSVDYSYDQSTNEVSQAYFQIHQGNARGISVQGSSEQTANNLTAMCSVSADASAASLGACVAAAGGILQTPGNLLPYLTAQNERLDEVADGAFGVHLDPSDIDTLGHAVNVGWDVAEDFRINFITSYREVEQLSAINYGGVFGIGLTNAPDRGIVDQDQFSQEFQFIGTTLGGKLDYVAGLYYYRESVYERGAHNGSGFLSADPADAARTIPAFGRAYPLLGAVPGAFGRLSAALANAQAAIATAAAAGNATEIQAQTQRAILAGQGLAALGGLAALPILDASGNPILVDPSPIIGADLASDPIYMTEVSADVESIALYAQFDYHMSEALDFTFGVRYSNDTRDAVRSLDLRRLANPSCNGSGPGTCRIERNVDSDNIDYNLVLSYALNKDLNLYWRYATGYKAAGVDRRSLGFGTFQDETLDSVEWGVKSLFADGRVRWNAAVFISNYRNKQNTFNDPTPGAMVTDTLTRNADGTVSIDGFESELNIIPVTGLTLGINYTYLDWEYPVQAPLIVTQQIGGVETPVEIDSGVRAVQSAPRHSGSFILDYEFPTYPFGDLSIHLDWISSTSFFYSPRHFAREDARDIINARLTLSAIPLDFRGDLRISLWGSNLTDEEYVIYSIDNLQSGVVSDAYGRPRTAGLEIVYEY